MALVAYGSDEDESDANEEGEGSEPVRVLAGLPSCAPAPVARAEKLSDSDVLDDLVKPKEWEKSLAEKRLKSHERKRKRGKTRIAAFGGLSSSAHVDSDSDDDEVAKKQSNDGLPSTWKKTGGLLAMLPQPKSQATNSGVGSKPSVILLPPSVRSRQTRAAGHAESRPALPTSANARAAVVEEDDDDNETGDFFGLNSSLDVLPHVHLGASYGPSKPSPADAMQAVPLSPYSTSFQESAESSYMHPSQMYNVANVDAEDMPKTAKGVISDLQAHKMIYKHELAPWGFADGAATDAVNSMIDVSVDETLGPNIRENLLKSLGTKVMPTSSVAVTSGGKKSRDPMDVNAKRKHQITYLAKVAVAREEQLQEQWSQNRQNKRMASQKYGFR